MSVKVRSTGASIWARRGIFVAIVGALVAMLVATAFDRGTEGKPNAVEEAEGLCGIEGIECGRVADASGREVQYALKRIHTQQSQGVLLLEAGGPGADVFLRSSDEFLELPAPLDRYDVLLIREPWVGQRESQPCVSGASDVATQLAAGTADTDSLLACDMLGWSETAYQNAVTAVGEAIGERVVGVVGQSFGSLPALSAAEILTDAWLVINAPMAHPSLGAANMAADQSAQLWQVLQADFDRWCAGNQCGASLDEAWSRAMGARSESDLDSSELSLAALAAAYDLEANGDWLWRTLQAYPHLETQTVNEVERMISQILRSYGDSQIDASMSAYALGLCHGYDGWSGVEPASGAGLSGALSRMSSLCAQLAAPGQAPVWELNELTDVGPSCIIVNGSDPVVASAWGTALSASIRHAEAIEIDRSGHYGIRTLLPSEPNVAACVTSAIEGETP